VFPINDDNPTRITPFVTYILIGLNIAVFVHEFTLSNAQLNNFFQLYAIIPEQLTGYLNGQPPGQAIPEWATLITSQFLHGGWWHLISNMVFLWVFGNNIEDRLGHIKYTFFYLACGILAGLSQWYIGMGSEIPSLGASGAISGVLGAYLIRFPHALVNTLIFLGIFFTTIRVPAWVLIGFFFAQNIFSGLMSLNAMNAQQGGVAYWAHIGGFVFGVILAPFLGLFREDEY
jgi:membrane associated rhomboid family serine protease